MKLQAYPTPDLGLDEILALHPTGYNANCWYGKRCKPYTIPITVESLEDLYWYVPASDKIESATYWAVDCEGNKEAIAPTFHIAGEDSGGNHYLAWNGLQAFPTYDIFQIWVELEYENGEKQTFFTEQYEVEECVGNDIIYACYSKDDNGGYDSNGTWVGNAINPYGLDSTAHVELRYYNNYVVRDLKVLYTGTTLEYTAFNSRPVKTGRTKTYTVYAEVLPYWYEESVSAAFAKGVVQVAGKQYYLTSYSSTTVGDPCCERITINATAQENVTIGMSCSIDECNQLEVIVLPDCSLGRLIAEPTTATECELGTLTYSILL
jgi:hypothetical protein